MLFQTKLNFHTYFVFGNVIIDTGQLALQINFLSMYVHLENKNMILY